MLKILLLATLLQTLVDDFEDRDFEAASGLDWMVIADEQIGGTSTARLVLVDGALRVEGEVRDGFAAPFAGVWVPLDGRGYARDLRDYRGLRFRARGSGGAFLAGFRRTSGGQAANFMGRFAPSASWSTFEIGFDELGQATPTSSPMPWSPHDVGWMGFHPASGERGRFWLELDDVELVEETPPPPQARTIKRSLSSPERLQGLEWRRLTEEDPGDGRFASLPQARSLSYSIDGDLLWFRIELEGEPPEDFFGVNVAIDGDDDATNGLSWWGFNQEFRFDRLVSVYLTKVGDRYQGLVGISDADGASRFDLTNLGFGNVDVIVDRNPRQPAIAVGVRREAVDADGRFHVIATVGSAFVPNDDVPDKGYAEVSIEK